MGQMAFPTTCVAGTLEQLREYGCVDSGVINARRPHCLQNLQIHLVQPQQTLLLHSVFLCGQVEI